jgi:hypothetical protein
VSSALRCPALELGSVVEVSWRRWLLQSSHFLFSKAHRSYITFVVVISRQPAVAEPFSSQSGRCNHTADQLEKDGIGQQPCQFHDEDKAPGIGDLKLAAPEAGD